MTGKKYQGNLRVMPQNLSRGCRCGRHRPRWDVATAEHLRANQAAKGLRSHVQEGAEASATVHKPDEAGGRQPETFQTPAL